MKRFIQILRGAGALLFAALLLAACSRLFDPSASQNSSAPQTAPDTGRVVIRIGNSNGAVRTIMPAAPDMFSRYELTLTKGAATLTPDAANIAGEGVAVELAAGSWTAAVSAFRQWTVSGGTTPTEYLAAKGSETLLVVIGGTNAVTVTVEPVDIEDAAGVKGIFSWDITLSEGLSSAELRLGDAEAVNLLETASGSAEMEAGTYDLFIALEKDGLNAGLYELVYIYPGLESPAVFDFSTDELDFTDTVLLAGTATVTNQWGAVAGSLSVSAYSDDAYQDAIADATVTSDSWLLSIPASYIGKSVYLKLGADNYVTLKDTHTVEVLPKNGQAGIGLELKFITGAAITGLEGVLQIGEAAGPVTAATTESGTKVWASSNTGVASIDAGTGVVTLVGAGDTTISYTVTAGNVVTSNSADITVEAAAN
jgi:hypothetical protein